MSPARFDLAWFRLDLKSGRVDLYARLEKEKALAEDEWRFRTVGQRLDGSAVSDLREAEGVPMKDTWFEVIPLLSTPCDLYALAVLAVRTLLVNKQTRLASSLDEMMSLARQAAAVEDDEATLPMRIQHLFDQDPRWAQNLGPHRLVDETVAVDEAFDLVPAELWWDMLAMIARMFPGLGRDSRCQDYGDAPPGGVHKIFDQVSAEADNLLLRSRSLIVIDWRYNREVHRVLRRLMTGLGEGERASEPQSLRA
jgi:hypothetical protein